jgi:hypothetical protein
LSFCSECEICGLISFIVALVAAVATAAESPDARPPWASSYKLRPADKEKLTAADFPGPDGIVYPDWTWAGVPGGIPKVPARAKIEDFGGKADDDRDDADALERGADEVGKRGGGALMLGAGVYHLDRPVLITRDGVVIRGAGANKTRIIFRYDVPEPGVAFLHPKPGAVVKRDTWIELHCRPKDLVGIELRAGGQVIASAKKHAHWGATFSLRTSGAALVSKRLSGRQKLTGIAEYSDGRKLTTQIEVNVSSDRTEYEARLPRDTSAIMFVGDYHEGREYRLAQDGRRGDTGLTLENAEGLKAGDRIVLRAPGTDRWKKLVRCACLWGEYRRTELLVTGVDGNRVRVNQPLRIEFPVIDGSYLYTVRPLRRCGVENLHLEQTHDLWTSGITFNGAWECWARGVTVKKAGRWPLYMRPGKWNEIRDCVFDDAWFKGGGGTAYAGWEYCHDSLMENVTTHKLRHAPCYQWAASGNVIRNSTFHESDGQWHSGWTHENLFENCVIDSRRGNGGYGYGLWASPPEDKAHGPNGPRNVVYRCDVRSPKAGLWMGGMNENWLILFNRFLVESGPGVVARTASFDHIIRGNVLCLRDEKQPLLVLQTPDCIGVELLDNVLHGGNGKLLTGSASLAAERGNVVHPAADFANPPSRPKPAVPSIFEWQRKHKAKRAGVP